MAVVSALRRVPGALARNPVLFVVFGLFGLVQVPQTVAQAVSPLLAGVLSLALTAVTLLVTPFVQAGAMEMADEALDGTTSLDSFVAAGTAYYLSVLGAYLVVFGVSAALGIVGFVVAILGGAAALGAGQGVGSAGLVVAGVVALVLILAYLAFAFLVQFYAQEIVLGGASAVESLKRSAALVRRNLLPTLGYFAVVLLGSLGFGGVIGAASVFVFQSGTAVGAATPSLASALVYAAVVVVGTAVLGALFTTYAVSFWRELRGVSPPSETADPTAP